MKNLIKFKVIKQLKNLKFNNFNIIYNCYYKKFLIVIHPRKNSINTSTDYILIINDDKSIIDLLTELKIAEMTY